MADVRSSPSGRASVSVSTARFVNPPNVDDDDDNEEEESEEEEEEDDEPPPPMGDSSDSEGDKPPPTKNARKPAARKKQHAASAAGDGGGGTRATYNNTGSSGVGGEGGGGGRTGRPAAAAAASSSANKATRATAGDASDPPLWKAFAKSRERGDCDALGVVALRKWISFEEGNTITSACRTWFAHQVLGNRSITQALMVPRLPSCFPEFCHWVADGNHKSCGGTLMPGFEPMAVQHVKMVKAAEREGRAPAAASAASRGAAPAAEPIGGGGGGGGGNDPRVRKRERRTRKGGNVANGAMLAEKMQNALAGLAFEGIDETAGEGDGAKAKAAGRAAEAGAQAEAEVHAALREELLEGDDSFKVEDVLGADLADSKLPQGTLVMLASLKRARAFRRRCDRQSVFLESELEKCLGRLARVEGQYQSLVAETTGRECTLSVAVARARPLLKEGCGLVTAAVPAQALSVLDEAIKLLEVHVNHSAVGGESSEVEGARNLLGLSLCNRSVANFLVGNFHSGQVDADRAILVWPTSASRDHLKRVGDFSKKSNRAVPNWSAFPLPA